MPLSLALTLIAFIVFMAYDRPLGRVGRALGRALKDWLRSERPVLRMDDFDRQRRGLNQFAWIFFLARRDYITDTVKGTVPGAWDGYAGAVV